ncbi:MAG: hypothetical protein AB7F59_02290 [Bdellovibrionales bacterium]
MKFTVAISLLVFTGCTTTQKIFNLADAQKEKVSQAEVKKCRADMLAVIEKHDLQVIRNLVKRFNEKNKTNNPLAGLDRTLKCGDIDQADVYTELAHSAGDVHFDLGSKECMYLPKTDKWGCLEKKSEFPRVNTNLKTDTAALQEVDMAMLKRNDEKSKDLELQYLLEKLHISSVKVNIQNKFPWLDWRTNTVSLTPLEMIHRRNVLMEYLIDFQAKDKKLYSALILKNKNNKALIATVLKEATEIRNIWEQARRDENEYNRLPSSYYPMIEIGRKFETSETVQELLTQ